MYGVQSFAITSFLSPRFLITYIVDYAQPKEAFAWWVAEVIIAKQENLFALSQLHMMWWVMKLRQWETVYYWE